MKLMGILALVCVMAASAFGAEVKDYFDGPTGATVRLNDDGTIKSIVATGESKLTSGDLNDELSAIKKATLQAQEHISEFVSKGLSSNEVMDDLSLIATKTAPDGKVTTLPSTTRQSLERQKENIRKHSHVILKGLVVLTTEVNKNNKYVKVLLGTDDKLMLAAVVPAVELPAGKPVVAAPAADLKKEKAKPVKKQRHHPKKHRHKKAVKKAAVPETQVAAPAAPAAR